MEVLNGPDASTKTPAKRRGSEGSCTTYLYVGGNCTCLCLTFGLVNTETLCTQVHETHLHQYHETYMLGTHRCQRIYQPFKTPEWSLF